MRLAIPIAIVALAAALLAGCGGSSGGSSGSESTAPPKASGSRAPVGASARHCDTGAVDAKALRATGLSCGEARRLMFGWQRSSSCALPPATSRASCTRRSYLCLSTRTARGVAVSCSRPGRSIAFLARR
ncbi:MAG: hypothetical protein U0R26_01905 [Solirubrobacterales bacterium]